jgi:hypothetical protein
MKIIFKRTFLFLLISLGLCSNLKSQTYFHFGYNAGFPLGLDSLNFVIDQYNGTRTYLDEPMKKINFLDGFTFGFGGIFEPGFYNVGFSVGVQRRFAEGVDISNVLVRRELKVNMTTFDFDFGLALCDVEKGAIFLGGSICLGGFTVKSRASAASEIRDQDWVRINPNHGLVFTCGFFLRFIIGNPGIFIQPYYQFTPGAIFYNDMTEVNEYLNPNTAVNDPSPLNIKNHTFGIKVGIGILAGSMWD